MATRRPASSRSRTNPMPPPPQPPRSRSVMAKPVTSQSHSHEEGDPELGQGSRIKQQKDEGGTNIQVVIRCRRRSEREVSESSPIIVTSSGARSKEISVETSTPFSSLGIVTLPPVRTYPFDLVFGPEADQAMIYHDVVSPMLEQVLMGYNCTLFAYGQTGTGKTYTMQGDLNPTQMGNPSTGAGMIPRVLFRLFHQLESSRSDYSVKISYVELYNEELRDLLATDFSTTATSVQPMGFAAKDNSKGNDNGLKIFDDAGKRGVFIQGLEEVAVKDSKAALGLLIKGSERRQIAATNFNEQSSRSHSVFSITIHTKDTSHGEDLLKTGKLHLVDLAGSENIGRSGAENKRAREAGMINQSLLTLGRVINALVDKAQHVPYRESKLTRLLQDSLGGRTKTCIIATISPARSNIEETLSTLDYALRAKSIRNKPELNQRMTRNALLKEYIAEIDRLKADLLAAREKNGIFFSEETWNQLNAEQELRQTEMSEAKKQVEIVESQLRGVREEFEQSIALLMKKDGQLKEIKQQLKDTNETLLQRNIALKETKQSLREEEVVRQAYQDSEKALDGIATDLKSTLTQSTRCIGELLEKLNRKSSTMDSNNKIVLQNGRLLLASFKDLIDSLGQFNGKTSQLHRYLQNSIRDFESAELSTLAQDIRSLGDRFRDVQEQLEQIKSDDDKEDVFGTMHQDLRSSCASFESELDAWSTHMKETLEGTCNEAGTVVKKQNVVVEKAIEALHLTLGTITRQAKEFVAEQRLVLAEMKHSSEKHATREIAHLKKQNEALAQLVLNERMKANSAKDDLIQRVSGLLTNFLQERDESIKNAVQGLQVENNDAQEVARTESRNHNNEFEALESRTGALDNAVQQRSREGKRKRESASKVLGDTMQVMDQALEGLQGSMNEALDSHSSSIQPYNQHIMQTCTSGFEEHARIKRARVDAITSIMVGLESSHGFVQSRLSSTSQSIETFANGMASNILELEDISQAYHDGTTPLLKSVNDVTTIILDKGIKEDEVTGGTPQKRQWNYINQWQLTKNREAVLNQWQNHGVSPPSPSIPLNSVIPVGNKDEEVENEVPMNQVLEGSKSKFLSNTGTDEKELLPIETLMASRRRNVSTRSSRR